MIDNFKKNITLEEFKFGENWINVTFDSNGNPNDIIKDYQLSGKNKIWHSDLAYVRTKSLAEKQNHKAEIQYLNSCAKLKAFSLRTVLADLDIIERLDAKHLEYLSLSFMDKYIGCFKKSNKLDLSFVKKFNNLVHLELMPDRTSLVNINDCRLDKLINLTLSYNNLLNIDFNCFPNLESLHLIGKTINNDQFECLKGSKIRYLGLSGFNSLKDLSFISELTNIQILSINRIKDLERLPNFSKLNKLQYIYISGCTKLMDFSSLENAPQIKGVYIVNRINKDFEVNSFNRVANNSSLEQFFYGYDYQSKKEINELLELFKERYKPFNSIVELKENGELKIRDN